MATEQPLHPENPASEYPKSACPTESECPISEYSESDTTIGEDREEEVIQEAVFAVLAHKEREN